MNCPPLFHFDFGSKFIATTLIGTFIVAAPTTSLAQAEQKSGIVGAGFTDNLSTPTPILVNREELPPHPLPTTQYGRSIAVERLWLLPQYSSRNASPLPIADATGTAPSLSPQPSTPQAQPFQPQNLPLSPIEMGRQRDRVAPSITVITPSAYGKSWGNLSVGLGLQTRTRFTNEADGVLGIGIGLGDEQKWVGLDIGITITDLLGTTAQDGTVSFKLHRQLPHDFSIAVGVQNAIAWGNTDGGRSPYGVVTKRFNLQDSVNEPFSQLYVSAGVGSGQFRGEFEIQNDLDSIDVFGSVAVRVVEPVSAIAEWTGQDVTIGLSVAPFRNIPLVITPAVTDITGSAGDGSRFILGIGYLITF
jgi:hypothetical protein